MNPPADLATDPGETPEVPSTRVTGHTARWVAVGVGVVLIVFIGVLATRQTVDEKGTSANIIGQPVPAVQGTTFDGGTYDIDEQRGRWVVVNFFATWCVPCVREHPELVKFTEAHEADADVSVVSVTYGRDGGVETFFEENGGDWPVIRDEDAQISLAFGVTGVPESYVISPDGVVVAKFLGVTAGGLEGVLAQYGGGSAAGESGS